MATAQTAEDKSKSTAAAKPVARKTAAKPAATKAAAKPATNAGAAKALKSSVAKVAKPAASAKEKPVARTAKPANRQSKDSSMTAKERTEHVERVWELAKRIGTAMFVTWDGEEQRARPLAATVEKDEGAIYFLTDVHGEKDEQIVEFPHVSISFADHKASKFVALSGTATVSHDREKIRDLWSPFAKAWWDSPEDPSIRVIKVIPRDAEFWDSPGRIVTTISMLAAAVTGRTPKIGENAKVTL